MKSCEVCFKREEERDGVCEVCHGVADDKLKRDAVCQKNVQHCRGFGCSGIDWCACECAQCDTIRKGRKMEWKDK